MFLFFFLSAKIDVRIRLVSESSFLNTAPFKSIMSFGCNSYLTPLKSASRSFILIPRKDSGAILNFNKAIELNPKNADAYYNRGFAKICLKEF